MDAHQLAVETAWLRLFLREASTRGYTIEDIVALLDEPGMTAWVRVFIREASKRGHTREDIIALLDDSGMTVKAAVERILSTRKTKVASPLRPTESLFPASWSSVAKVRRLIQTIFVESATAGSRNQELRRNLAEAVVATSRTSRLV